MIIEFIKKLFTKEKDNSIRKILEEYSIYLSPWYFKDGIPNLGKELIWKKIEKLNGHSSPLTCLYDGKNCVGILDIYCYLKPLANDKFLTWRRGERKIELYSIADLKPIETNKIIWSDLSKHYHFNAKPISQLEYNSDLYQTEIDFEFPASFKFIDEIIQVNDLDGMYEDYEKGMSNTAIVVLKPKDNQINIYPQDWFNKAKDIDFGYQWITRAERIENTKRFKIQGIRLGDYELDHTNRNIARSTNGNNV